MSVKSSGGSPAVRPNQFNTLPTAVISQAEQQDRSLNRSELKDLSNFFKSGAKRLEVVATLNQNADPIVAAGGNRIFWGGNPMDYLERPKELVNLPGYGRPVTFAEAALARAAASTGQAFQVSEPEDSTRRSNNPISRFLESVQGMMTGSGEPLPGGFRIINISRYGPVRMKRSMRDLAWFLRYVAYAIVAGDASILTANVRGLRAVMPEDITVATVVALKEMRWKSLSYFSGDEEAKNIITQYFDILIEEYQVEKPPGKLRQGISNDQQGLQLPESYLLSAESRPKFVMKIGLSATEKQAAIKAAYRQVFESDITRAYGLSLPDLESKVKGGNISMKEFIRYLGKSRFYRRMFYEPYNISRVIELAFRHFLGRALSSLEEFQDYFDLISKGGLAALVDALVDSPEYGDYFGEEMVPYLRGLGLEAQECRNWGSQFDLFKFSAPVRKVPQFVTTFANSQKPLPNQHSYGAGHDPLEIQFGAIFPQETRNPAAQPAPFGKDTRRILISCGSAKGNGASDASALGKAPSFGINVFKLDKGANGNGNTGVSMSLVSNHSVEAVIQGAYQQVFGRDVYAGQRLPVGETKLKGGEMSMREFIRYLAKSRLFRSLYWEKLYITKAIEYIHRRLLGRPTYGRSETNQYYDLCAKKGFYGLIDQIIDSPEYIEAFGEDTAPYERYLTPRGFAMRSLREPVTWSQAQRDRTQTAAMVVAQKVRERNQAAQQSPVAASATQANQSQSQQEKVEPAQFSSSSNYSQSNESSKQSPNA